ncbi:AcrB/AcrD/AcrF family protein [Sphingomonas sp. VNH70]|uniref:AcrB/AcrD/AcrF family protein n=1 Tax=Sphingomonas silueang TaxID=3156617 RepID=UPI0032B5192B
MNDRATLPQGLERHWLRWALLAWAVLAAYFLWNRWNAVHWLALSDTDDNMRLMQVRAWLNGQAWYDLRQYRLNPPGGLDIHWSRIVDLPIAALILLLKPFAGTAWAERLAVGIAPLLPMGVAMVALAVTVRRLVAPMAWPLAVIFLLGCSSTLLMFMPERIDHHGWQLACLAWTVAGLADPKRARGGLAVALSSAVSLNIGLELLPYCGMAGAIVALRWVWDRAESRRLAVYGAVLAGGNAGGFVAFASNANYAMRCDALTPVWLSAVVAGGALLVLLAWANPRALWLRLVLALVAGGALAATFATLFPNCLHRPEGVSDELTRIWLNNVREAKPLYAMPWRTILPIVTGPLVGLVGALYATWRARRSAAVVGWAAVALFTAFAVAMLFWQIRSGPAAQLLAVPGTVALAWIVVPWLLTHRSPLVRVGGTVAAFLLLSSTAVSLIVQRFRIDPPDARTKLVLRAGARCASLPALQALDRLPPAVMFTHVDLGPRLIVATHHDGITGPYHRNGDAILDVHHAFQGDPALFRRIAQRHGATYLLTCPNMAETTNYRARSPDGFYGRLAKGERFDWLTPVPLPKGSPLRLWRIAY